jgi:hypothetical protein
MSTNLFGHVVCLIAATAATIPCAICLDAGRTPKFIARSPALPQRKSCRKFLDTYIPDVAWSFVNLEAFMIARIVIGLILFCLTLSNANAASILLRTYKSPIDKADKALLKVYLDGVKEGIVMLNVTLQVEGRQPLFCQPQKLALTVEQAEEIMMRKAKKMANPDGVPISLILIHGL